MKQHITTFTLLLLLGLRSIAQTPTAGSIAFIGYNSDAPDGYTFIVLDSIGGGIDIMFTDEGLKTSSTWSTATEDHYRLTTPTAGMPIGTIVSINESTGATVAYWPSGFSTAGSSFTWITGATSGNLNISSGGDQIMAYGGSSKPSAPPSTFYAAINMDNGSSGPCYDASTKWHNAASAGACITSTSESAIPNGLTDAVNSVSMYPGTGVTESDNAKYTGTLTGTSTQIRASIANRSNWTLDNNNNIAILPANYSSPSITAVPIKLIAFDAKITARSMVELNWATASELNNDFFTIERSSNGVEWEIATTMPGAGNSQAVLEYSFLDFTSTPDLTFYRLKQTDYDGTFEYSKVITVSAVDNKELQLSLHPNPAHNKLMIEGEILAFEDFDIFDLTGKNVSSLIPVTVLGITKIELDLNSLTNGVYYIKTRKGQTSLFTKR